MVSNDFAAIFLRDITRLIQEVQAFPDTASLWATAPGVSNAAGTLVLHLEGNMREYIGRQLGQIAYTRDRPLEFSARGVEQAELVARLQAVLDTIPPVLRAVSAETLDAPSPERMFNIPTSTHLFLLHLSGHLNYHLGQIDYLRRFATGNPAIELAQM